MSDTTPPGPVPAVIEICGEGKTDVSKQDSEPVPATEGVVPVLVRRLCCEPADSATFRVKRRPFMFLQGKGLWQKVRGAKRNARINGSAACVFVMDSEGDPAGVLADLVKGRDSESLDYPTAIGVAHPCIEAWLLSDASAIRQGLGITGAKPTVPEEPESLPAPQQDRKNNPKTVLDALHPKRNAVNAVDKTAIAGRMAIPDDLTQHPCPSFAAFAVEVRTQIRDRFFQLPTVTTDDEPTEEAPDATPPA